MKETGHLEGIGSLVRDLRADPSQNSQTIEFCTILIAKQNTNLLSTENTNFTLLAMYVKLCNSISILNEQYAKLDV